MTRIYPPITSADSLDDLTDVNIPAPNNGDVLTYDALTSEWVSAPGAPTSLSNATPQNLGIASAGTGTAASRDDHVHAMPALDDLTNINAPAPNNGDVLTYDTLTSEWVSAPGGATSLSNATPQPLGIASAGVGTSASRDDHVHAMPALDDLTNINAPTPNDGDVLTYDNATSDWISSAPVVTPLSNATPQNLGVASAGVSTSASRDDHVHAVPALNDLSNVSVAAPNNLDVLTYDNATSTWIAAAGGGGGGGWPTSTGTDTNGRVYEQALVATANTSLIISPTGTGGLQTAIADNAATGGDSRGDNAVDWQTVRSASTQVASGVESVIGGGDRNTASGTESVVSGGQVNAATSTGCTVGGGRVNSSTSGDSTVGGGLSNLSTNSASTVSGGDTNTASGNKSSIPGGERGVADQRGMFSHASGRFSIDGDAQYSRMIMRRQTTDATPTVLTADGTSGGSDDRVTLPAESAFCFDIYVIATQSAGVAGTASDSAWWHFRGGIKRDNSNNTTLIGSNTSETGADAGAAAWQVSVTANDVNESLQIEVTGEALKTIRWVATVQYARVAY